MQTTISRVFMNGNSQAVRIPQEFRFDTTRVEIHRNADGDLVLHPVPADRGAALLQAGDRQVWLPFDTPGAVSRLGKM